jgi:hypothetical protein
MKFDTLAVLTYILVGMLITKRGRVVMRLFFAEGATTMGAPLSRFSQGVGTRHYASWRFGLKN